LRFCTVPATVLAPEPIPGGGAIPGMDLCSRGARTVASDMLFVARAEALAVSTWSAAQVLDRAAADAVIRASVQAHGGIRGCAAALAQEFGDHPETIAERMARARLAVRLLYPGQPLPAPAPPVAVAGPAAGRTRRPFAPFAPGHHRD
jgi:hypothetical protein